MTLRFIAAAGLVALAAATPRTAAAEQITIATSQLLAYVAVPIMLDKGFLAEEGLEAKLVTFDSAQPITVAVAAGDADFGVGGLSAAFFNLAGSGQLRIIAAGTREMPGFYNFAILASNRAVSAGLKSLKDLPGRTVGVTQLGTTLEYSLGRLAEIERLDFKAIRVSPLQSNSNVISALTGGQIDAAVMPGAPTEPSVARGDFQRLAWVCDVVPGVQNNVAFTSTRLADEHPDIVNRFLMAYRKASRLYHDAVAGADEHRRDGSGLADVLPILAKFAKLTPEQAKRALPWVDGEARVDTADVARQVAWFRAHGMIKGDADAASLVDARFAVTLPVR